MFKGHEIYNCLQYVVETLFGTVPFNIVKLFHFSAGKPIIFFPLIPVISFIPTLYTTGQSKEREYWVLTNACLWMILTEIRGERGCWENSHSSTLSKIHTLFSLLTSREWKNRFLHFCSSICAICYCHCKFMWFHTSFPPFWVMMKDRITQTAVESLVCRNILHFEKPQETD